MIRTIINNFMRRTLAFALAVMLCLTMVPAAVFANDTGAGGEHYGITWSYSAGKLTLSGDDVEMINYDEFAPWLDFCQDITEVVINKGVLTIGQDAFFCWENLQTVHIPTSVTEIGYGAFGECPSLTDIYYSGSPYRWSEIDMDDPEELDDVKIHYVNDEDTLVATEGVCGDDMTWKIVFDYDEYNDWTYLYISGSGEMYDYSLEEPAPWAVHDITNIYFDEGITSVGKYAFYDMYLVSFPELPSTMRSIGDYAFCGGGTWGGEIVISEGVEHIGDYAFFDCIGWYGDFIALPHSLQSVGEMAFACEEFEGEALNLYYNGTQEEWDALDIDPNFDGGGDDTRLVCNTTGACGDNLIYTFENRTLTISGTGPMYDYESEYDAPWAYWQHEKLVLEKGITHIGDYAFYEHNVYEDVHIPEGVVSIGDYAFNCYAMDNLYLPVSLKEIGVAAFDVWDTVIYAGTQEQFEKIAIAENNGWLEFAEIYYLGGGKCGDNLTWSVDEELTLTISGTGPMYNYDSEESRPWGTFITEVVLEDGVTAIGEYAFFDCNDLKKISLPSTLVTIGDYSLYDCYSLEELYIPASVTKIHESVLSRCFSLKRIEVAAANPNYCSSAEGVLFNKNKTEILKVPAVDTYTIPSGVTVIGVNAFDITKIKSIEIPYGVTTIGAGAFGGCTKLENITIPESVTAIGASAFADTQLKQVTIPSGVTVIERSLFYYSAIESVTLPEGLTEIREGAFSDCYELQQITIPEGVKTIGEYAFAYTSINSIEIPNSVTSIGDYAFSGCYDLDTAVIGDGLTQIPDGMFEFCESLSSVTIGNSVTSIGEYAFCETALTSIEIPDSVTSIGDGAFACTSLNSIEIPESVTSIGEDVFSFCYDLTTAVIGDGLTHIPDGMFEYCESLSSVTIGNSVTSIGESAFYECDSLTDVYYNGTEVQWNAISIANYNEKLQDAIIHLEDGSSLDPGQRIVAEGVCGENLIWTLNGDGDLIISGTGKMGDYGEEDPAPWEDYRYDIKTVTIESGVTNIASFAFYVYGNITSVSIPETVVDIEYYAFGQNDNLAGIWVDENNTAYSSDECGVLFNKEKTQLLYFPGGRSGAYTIPDGVLTIGSEDMDAFTWHSNLTAITIPSSVIIIEPGQFEYCSGLTDVYYNGTQSQWDMIYVSYRNDDLLNANIHFGDGSSLDGGQRIVAEGVCGENLIWTLNGKGELVISGTGKMEFDEYAPWDFYWDDIKTVTIEPGVTNIASFAFYYYRNIISVSIPEGVTTIGDGAFDSCSDLVDVYYNGTESQWDMIDVADNNDDLLNANIHFGDGSSSGSESAFVAEGICGENLTWTLDKEGNLVVSGTGNMGDYGEEDPAPWEDYRYDIKTVTIEPGVTNIASFAFYVYRNITSVSIPETVVDIEYCAFGQNDNLAGIWVDENNTAYSSDECGVLFNKEKTQLLYFPGGLSGAYTIPDGVLTIGSEDMDGFYCSNLTSITIPNSVTVIELSAFGECSGLTEVYYNGTQSQWDDICVWYGNDDLLNANIHFVEAIQSGVVDENGNQYDTFAEALKETKEGETLTLIGDVTEDITVSKTVTIDLNGNDMTGVVTVADGAVLYGKDSRTDDYTVEDEDGYGKINVGSGKVRSVASFTIEAEDGYLMITEADGISFHKVDMKITAMSLRASAAGVYYKSQFAGDEVVARNVECSGVALSVVGIPTEKNLEKCELSSFAGFAAGSSNKTSTLLNGVMKSTNSDEINNQNAEMPVYGRAYILTKGGQYIFGTAVKRSFRQQVEAVDEIWGQLTDTQKTGVLEMYNTYKNTMDAWDIPNLKANLQ